MRLQATQGRGGGLAAVDFWRLVRTLFLHYGGELSKRISTEGELFAVVNSNHADINSQTKIGCDEGLRA